LLANRASILWTTAQPGLGTVAVVGPDGVSTTFPAAMQPFAPAETALPATYYQYQADITGLSPGNSYSYSVIVDGQDLASAPSQFSFTTPAPGKFSFLSFGDSGADSPAQRSLIQLMAAEPGIAKVIHVGDVAYESGTFAQFETNYFALYAPLMSRMPFFTTPGNHDYETNNAAPYLAGNAAPVSGVPVVDAGRYYSFDWGDAHFVSVDSNLLPTDSASQMLQWLDNDLASTGKYWRIVFLHHPPYPTGIHLDDPICALAQQNVNPIVERHGVQLVLSGHEHGYERSWPLAGGQPVDSSASGPSTTYVITGGGGQTMEEVGSLPQTAIAVQAFHYLRVDVDNNQLSFSAIGLSGNVIDQVTLAPAPQISANGVLSTGDYTPAVASGSLASIFGQSLAVRPSSSPSFPLATQLGGLAVTANGQPVPLLYVSASQINIQIPYEVSGQVNLQITTPNGSASTTFPVVPLAPSILAITVQNAICTAANPAVQSGYVTVYATGLGAASLPVATGQTAPAMANPMAVPAHVWLGNIEVQPAYAGLAPGFAGLSQLNFAVPASLPDGTYSLRITAGTASSQPQNLIVGTGAGASPNGGPTGGASGSNSAVSAAYRPVLFGGLQ
jgi:acid phosphatase type 7